MNDLNFHNNELKNDPLQLCCSLAEGGFDRQDIVRISSGAV
ncbi:MAG: hypothetical protein ACXADB_11535 [Candidatus Hermodarchaeia archaeon]